MATDLVWNAKLTEWVPASKVKGLFDQHIQPQEPGPPPLPKAELPPALEPPVVSTNAVKSVADLNTYLTTKCSLNRFVPASVLEALSKPLIAIGATIAILVALVLFDNFYITSLTIFSLAALVYVDASSNQIGAIPPRSIWQPWGNLSPTWWAVRAVVFWIIVVPLYLVKRPKLIEKAAVSPQEEHGAVWKLVGLAVFTVAGLFITEMKVNRLFGTTTSQLEAQVKNTLQHELDGTINKLTLVQETDTRFTGIATTTLGKKYDVNVVVDKNGEKFVWECRELWNQ